MRADTGTEAGNAPPDCAWPWSPGTRLWLARQLLATAVQEPVFRAGIPPLQLAETRGDAVRVAIRMAVEHCASRGLVLVA